MRIHLGCMVLGTAMGLLIRVVGLLGCECANVTPWDFALVFLVMIGGFALMLPDRER